MNSTPRLRGTLRRDIEAVLQRDPAARHALEVVLCYPGLHALWMHRLAHGLWKRRFLLAGRLLAQFSRFCTGIEIHPGATIGAGFFIDHGMGVVIGETATIGENVTLYHGATLGGTSQSAGKRHPTLEDGVVVGAGAAVLGDIVVGRGSRIGANAVVVKPVPPESVVVGVPGQVVKRSHERAPSEKPDLDHTALPDAIGITLTSLMQRVETLEKTGKTNGAAHQNDNVQTHPQRPQEGYWRGEDFSI